MGKKKKKTAPPTLLKDANLAALLAQVEAKRFDRDSAQMSSTIRHQMVLPLSDLQSKAKAAEKSLERISYRMEELHEEATAKCGCDKLMFGIGIAIGALITVVGFMLAMELAP